MQKINILAATSFLILSCFFSKSALAYDADSEVRWFVNLVKTYNGKAFCAPLTTKFTELASALSSYSKKHPEFHDRLNDQQAVQGLAESYPCSISATPELANTEISKIGARNIEVTPKGEFATIDTKPTIAIMQKLKNTVAHENDSLVDEITKNSGNHSPIALFALADLLYRQGDVDGAVFWFNAAMIRGNYDAALCTDVTAKSAIPTIVRLFPNILKSQFDDIPKLKDAISRVLKWDETTPYNYDHRWISLHGMRAINSGLSNDNQNEPLLVPAETWGALAVKNREQYQKSLDDAIKMRQKH